jgi:hypothetical protein
MVREDEISLIAYKIWEEEGRLHGHDYEHWFRAEAIWDQQQVQKASVQSNADDAEKDERLKMMNDLMKNIRDLAAHHYPIDDEALMILEKCYEEWLRVLGA